MIPKHVNLSIVVSAVHLFNPRFAIEIVNGLVKGQYPEVPSLIEQSVTCLTADSGVGSLIPDQSHTFVEIDHEIISTVILLPSPESFKKACCQLQAKVYARSTG